MSDKIKQRLLDSVFFEPNSGCWMWAKSTVKGGYGKIGIQRKIKLAHRVSYEIFYGGIPKGMLVCHKCDNPSCINPEHLWLGTVTDNNRDTVKKKRHAVHRGKYNSRKLSDTDLSTIRASNLSQKALAEQFSVTQSTISNVKSGKTWGAN